MARVQTPNILGDIIQGRQARAFGQQQRQRREDRNILAQQRTQAADEKDDEDRATLYRHLDPNAPDEELVPDYKAALSWHVQENPTSDPEDIAEIDRRMNFTPDQIRMDIQQGKNHYFPEATQQPDKFVDWGYGQKKNVRTGEIVKIPTKDEAGKGEGVDFKKEQQLRKEFSSETSHFQGINNAYTTVKANASNPSPAGDIGLVFSIMKMFDPTSVVRESEFATAANAASVPERVRGVYNKALSGERLTDVQRKDFADTAERLFAASKKKFQGKEKRYKKLAKSYGMDPERITYGYGTDEQTPQAQYQEGQTATGPGGARVVFRNGQWEAM